MLVDKDGKEMKIGEEYILADGEKVKLLWITPPRDAGKSAKCYVERANGFKHELNHHVLGAKWI